MKILKKLEIIIMTPIAKVFCKFNELLTSILGVDWGAREEDF